MASRLRLFAVWVEMLELPLIPRCVAGSALLGALLAGACGGPPGPTPLSILDTNVFESETGNFVPGQTVVVWEGRVVEVAPSEQSRREGAGEVLDGTGRFLIPGLVDAHIHLTHVLYQAGMTGDGILPYFLANGVTSVRSTGDNVAAQSLLGRWAESNVDKSPRLFLASPLIGDAPPIHQDIAWSLTAPAQVPVFVEHMSKWGLTTLKIYANCRPSVARKVIEEGHKRGFVVTGHLSSYRVEDAIRDGIDSLEHIESVSDFLRTDPTDRHSLEVNGERAQRIVSDLAESGVYVNPTLSVFRGTLFFVDVPEIVNDPDNLRMPTRLRDFWAADRKTRLSNYSSGPLETRQRTFRKYQDLVGMLHQAGVKILVGTDAPEPQVPPGYSLHKEMELLVESGMPPADVLRAATLFNAEVLGQHENIGRVAAGMLADLVLLDENPLEDIRNTRRIRRVIRSGRSLGPEEILEDLGRTTTASFE